MPSTVSLDSVAVPRRRRSRASTSSELPHWSEVDGERRRERPSPTVAGILSDLVSWAADIAVLITRGCPEDREAIDRVRHYALSWLANEPCPGVEIDDVLTTAAALMAGIDRDLGSEPPDADEHERLAIGAAVAA